MRVFRTVGMCLNVQLFVTLRLFAIVRDFVNKIFQLTQQTFNKLSSLSWESVQLISEIDSQSWCERSFMSKLDSAEIKSEMPSGPRWALSTSWNQMVNSREDQKKVTIRHDWTRSMCTIRRRVPCDLCLEHVWWIWNRASWT